MQNAIQLTQEEAVAKLVELRVLEQHPAPAVRAIQVIACHGPEESYIFAMTREPALPGFDAIDAWQLTGPLQMRQMVTGVIQSAIAKRHQQPQPPTA